MKKKTMHSGKIRHTGIHADRVPSVVDTAVWILARAADDGEH